jgi:hypothetical protein
MMMLRSSATRLLTGFSHTPTRLLRRITRVMFGADEYERGSHLSVRAAPGELGGRVPEVDAVFVSKGAHPDAMLLVMVLPAPADAETVMRSLALAGIGGGMEMGKVDSDGAALRNAAAMRSDPAAVLRPDLLQCPASTPMRQKGRVEEGRISGHRSH